MAGSRASAAILVVVHHFALSQAERGAARQAGLLASAVFQREVVAKDVRAPVSGERRKQLDSLLRAYGLEKDVTGLSLVRHDGLVTYSTDHTLIGTKASAALASEAAAGTIVSTISSSRADGGGKALATYAPVGPTAARGAALITQSYEPIAAAARSLQLRVNGAVVLSALAFPSTGSWATWREVTAAVTLNAGANTIRVDGLTRHGAPLAGLTYALQGIRVSDPIGPIASDPDAVDADYTWKQFETDYYAGLVLDTPLADVFW